MTEQLRQSLSAVIDDEADAFELRRVLNELDRDPELRATWARYHLIGSVLRGERIRPPGDTSLAHRLPDVAAAIAAGAGVDAEANAGTAMRSDGDEKARATGPSDPAIPATPAVDGGRTNRRSLWIGGALAAAVALMLIVPPGTGDGVPESGDAVSAPAVASGTPAGEAAPSTVLPVPDRLQSSTLVADAAVAPVAPGADDLGTGFIPEQSLQAARVLSSADRQRARLYMLQHARQRGLEQQGVMSLVKMATYESP